MTILGRHILGEVEQEPIRKYKLFYHMGLTIRPWDLIPSVEHSGSEEEFVAGSSRGLPVGNHPSSFKGLVVGSGPTTSIAMRLNGSSTIGSGIIGAFLTPLGDDF